MYACDAGLDEVKHVYVDLPRIGKFEYNLLWEDLEQVSYNKEDNHYVEVSSTLHLYGEFVTLLDYKAKPIYTIQETIADLINKSKVYSHKYLGQSPF